MSFVDSLNLVLEPSLNHYQVSFLSLSNLESRDVLQGIRVDVGPDGKLIKFVSVDQIEYKTCLALRSVLLDEFPNELNEVKKLIIDFCGVQPPDRRYWPETDSEDESYDKRDTDDRVRIKIRHAIKKITGKDFIFYG